MRDGQKIDHQRRQGVDLVLEGFHAALQVLGGVGHVLLSMVLQPGEAGESGAGSNLPPMTAMRGLL